MWALRLSLTLINIYLSNGLYLSLVVLRKPQTGSSIHCDKDICIRNRFSFDLVYQCLYTYFACLNIVDLWFCDWVVYSSLYKKLLVCGECLIIFLGNFVVFSLSFSRLARRSTPLMCRS